MVLNRNRLTTTLSVYYTFISREVIKDEHVISFPLEFSKSDNVIKQFSVMTLLGIYPCIENNTCSCSVDGL